MKVPTYNNKCTHLFCANCISHWLKLSNNCPLCKVNLSVLNLTHVINNQNNNSSSNLPTKYVIIENIIKNKDKKTLLWINSNLNLGSKYIYKYLSENDVKFEIFKGNYSAKNSILQKFKSGNLDVLILNLKEDIPGLNLQYITDIIFLSDVISEYENAISKVNRIGIDHTITVHKFTSSI